MKHAIPLVLSLLWPVLVLDYIDLTFFIFYIIVTAIPAAMGVYYGRRGSRN